MEEPNLDSSALDEKILESWMEGAGDRPPVMYPEKLHDLRVREVFGDLNANLEELS